MFPSLNPPCRILMGPGPSNVPSSVLRTLAAPTVGHLDPYFLTMLDELREMLRSVLRTTNSLTLPVSGTGSSGMEAIVVNLVEPGDPVLVCEHGAFGKRIADIARRVGADVTTVAGPWGRALPADRVREVARGRPFKVVAVVHAETSTGVIQDIAPIREIADEIGALLVVDAVTSVGGIPLETDAWRIDALYAGTQKCLSCPPGLAPVTLSDRAARALNARKSPVQSFYLDLSVVEKYWSRERAYHHTAPINMLYALHEALRLVLEEGLENRWHRHARLARGLVAGLETLGLEPRVPPAERLPQLTTVAIPDGVDDARTRRALLEQYGVEIGAGLGPMAGNTWRFGLMGASCTRENVLTCLAALGLVLRSQGHRASGDAPAAAEAAWDDAE